MLVNFFSLGSATCSFDFTDYTGLTVATTTNRGFLVKKNSDCIGATLSFTKDGSTTATNIEFSMDKGYWEPGTYEFKKDSSISGSIAITSMKTKDFTHFVFYHSASHSFLLSMLEFLKNGYDKISLNSDGKRNVHFYYTRANTFSKSKIEELIKPVKVTNQFTPGEVAADIYDIYKNNPNARVWFARTDVRAHIGYQFFDSLGLSQDKYQDNMFSDGSLTYVKFYECLGEKKNDCLDKTKLDDIVLKARQNNTESIAQYFIWDKIHGETMSNLMFIQAATEGHQLIVLQPSLLNPGTNTEMKKVMDSLTGATNAADNHLNVGWDKGIIEGYQVMDQQKRTLYNELAEFDPSEFEKLYLAKGKKTLVILGSRDGGLYGTNDYFRDKKGFEAGLDVVDTLFGSEYRFVYKPHPSQDTSGIQPILSQRGIPIIRGSLPAEFFLWQFPDQFYLGGYISTVFLSAKPERSNFLYMESNAELTGMWREIYDGQFSILKGTLFMKPIYKTNMADLLIASESLYQGWVVGVSVVVPIVIMAVVGFLVFWFVLRTKGRAEGEEAKA